MEKFKKIEQEVFNAKDLKTRELKTKELKNLVLENTELYGELYAEFLQSELNDLKTLNTKQQLSGAFEFLPFSYISEKYFGKSKSWFSQRLNEHLVNGKPSQFTDEEIEILNFALQDLSKKIGSIKVV